MSASARRILGSSNSSTSRLTMRLMPDAVRGMALCIRTCLRIFFNNGAADVVAENLPLAKASMGSAVRDGVFDAVEVPAAPAPV